MIIIAETCMEKMTKLIYDRDTEKPEHWNDDTLYEHNVVRRSASPLAQIIIRPSGDGMYP